MHVVRVGPDIAARGGQSVGSRAAVEGGAAGGEWVALGAHVLVAGEDTDGVRVWSEGGAAVGRQVAVTGETAGMVHRHRRPGRAQDDAVHVGEVGLTVGVERPHFVVVGPGGEPGVGERHAVGRQRGDLGEGRTICGPPDLVARLVVGIGSPGHVDVRSEGVVGVDACHLEVARRQGCQVLRGRRELPGCRRRFAADRWPGWPGPL